MKKKICKKCGKNFALGYTGVCIGGKNLCDTCAGVKRDKDGYAITPEDMTTGAQVLKDLITGKLIYRIVNQPPRGKKG